MIQVIKDFFHVRSLRKELNNYISNKEKKEFTEEYKAEFFFKLKNVFPDEPCVIDGYWSWANQTIDFLYPELMLYNHKENRWETRGLAIQLYEYGKADIHTSLYDICQKNDVPLLLSQINQEITLQEIIKQIEAVFNNELSIPQE